MKIIIQTIQQLKTFVNPAELLSNQKIRIAAIATAAFTVLGALLSISYYLNSKKLKNITLPPTPSSPFLDRQDLKVSPQTQKQSESSINKINVLTSKLAIDFDHLENEVKQTKNDLKDLQQELSDIRDMTLDYDKRLKALESQKQAAAPILQQAVQAQTAKDSFIQKFNDKYCVLEQPVRHQFPKGIKLDDFFTQELQEIVEKYPNMRFYFTLAPGARPSIQPDVFSDAVTKGPDDAIWCIVTMYMGHSKINISNTPFQNQNEGPQLSSQKGKSGIAVFGWSFGLPFQGDPLNRSINENDNEYNAPVFFGMLAALQDNQKRLEAMNSVKAFKG